MKIKLRWADFTTFTRQTTTEQPTNQCEDIFKNAKKLFFENWSPDKSVRLLGVGVSGLGPPIRQLSLWESDSVLARLERDRKLRLAILSLRDKFGDRIIYWGTGQE